MSQIKSTLTHDELVALPEMRPAFAIGEGGIVKDRNGSVWLVGQANGTLCKSELQRTTFQKLKQSRQ